MAALDNLDDEPLTLVEACRLLFRGTITPSSLRAEAKRGRLVIERIGRTDFVTRAAIREMRRQCVLDPPQKAPASGCNRPESAGAESPIPPSGSSATTEDSSVALASALRSVAALKAPSRPTSRKSTASHPANVIPLRG